MTVSMRRWKARLLIDGACRQGVYVCGFHIDCNRYERCDTAHLMVAIRDGAGFLSSLDGRTGHDRPDIMIQVCDDNLPQSGWTTVFNGILDAVTLGDDPSSFGLECRDYMAYLLDTRMTSSWSNRTALEIVQQAVQEAGLAFQSDLAAYPTGDSLYCGQFWQLEHRRLSASTQHRYQTAFDLAFSLARDHGYECCMNGRTLQLQRPVSAEMSQIFRPEGVSLASCRYDLGLENSVVVGVRSWDSRQRAKSEIYFDGKNYTAEPPVSGVALHTFRRPGQRMEDVRRLAEGKHKRIVSHAVEARVSLPAMIGLKPRHFMLLDKPAMERSRTLSVDAVEHFFDLTNGYRQDVTLRDRIF